MARASGRRCFSAEITSSPLPSPSRMSTTAKAGATRLDLQQAVGDRFRRWSTLKPRALHGARQPLQERLVVLDDQQRAFARDRDACGFGSWRAVIIILPGQMFAARISSHPSICIDQIGANPSGSLEVARGPSAPVRRRRARELTVLETSSVAPERSSSVLAMKKPRPRPLVSPPTFMRRRRLVERRARRSGP